VGASACSRRWSSASPPEGSQGSALPWIQPSNCDIDASDGVPRHIRCSVRVAGHISPSWRTHPIHTLVVRLGSKALDVAVHALQPFRSGGRFGAPDLLSGTTVHVMESRDARLQRFQDGPAVEIIETLLNSINNYFNPEIRAAAANDCWSLSLLGIHAVAFTVAESLFDSRGSAGYKEFLRNSGRWEAWSRLLGDCIANPWVAERRRPPMAVAARARLRVRYVA
jgi:hypothetical protein